MEQVVRTLTMAESRAVYTPHVLICDRDRKWSGDVRRRLRDGGIPRGPHPRARAKCERLRGAIRAVDQRRMPRSADCDRGAAFPRAVAEYVEHYHEERNHQGLDNRLISGPPVIKMTSRVRRRPRLVGSATTWNITRLAAPIGPPR